MSLPGIPENSPLFCDSPGLPSGETFAPTTLHRLINQATTLLLTTDDVVENLFKFELFLCLSFYILLNEKY
jgi:hypothetical protein